VFQTGFEEFSYPVLKIQDTIVRQVAKKNGGSMSAV